MKVINFTIKIILSSLCMFMWWINIIIVVIMRDGKFMVAHQVLELIWDKPSINYIPCCKELPKCKHENIMREDGLDECLDCGVRNY